MEADLTKAVILAGGLGTRLRPLTDATPKPLLLIRNKPIIQHAVENFKKYNILDIVLAISYKAEQIMAYFGDGSEFGVKITYSIEKELMGTGGALRYALQDYKKRLLAINGDNLADFNYHQMLQVHLENQAKITIALYPVQDVTKFGIAELKGARIVRFIEKPTVEEAPTNLNNAGAYIIEPGVLEMLPKGKCSIERDCFENQAAQGGVYAYIHKGQWFPTDDLGKFNKAREEYMPK
ncbi:MAG: nucleotidyltransferase family protein [Candidatus Woesearchaeota archaeon]